MKRSKHTLPKRKLLPILGLLAVVGIVSGVFAVNQDNAFFNNLFNLGYLEAEYTETFVSPPDWKTCQEVPKTVVTTNNGPSNFKVRLSYDEFWRNAADTENLPLIRDGETLALINFQNEDDWTRHGDWYYYNQEVEPGQSTTSLFKSVTLNCDANMAQDNVCVETSTGQECTAPEDPYEAATYHLDITVQTTTGDFPREDEFYDVTVDPNGGTFQGNAEPYTASLQYGTVLDLSSIAYADHEFAGWTINGDEEAEKYTEDSITIDDHITLKANWIWGIYHDVTLNPDGGELDGSTDPIVTSVRHEDSYTIPETEPTRTDYLFDAWTINGIEVSSYTFAVTDDVEIVATWSPVVAKNENTGAFFRSINDANDAASAGDTITLLDDTVENVVITKNITLNLGTHTVVGSLTNNAGANLTLLNGEINNPEGIAVTNNGTLTLGIDDYKPDGTVDIKADYVRLIGTTTGLKQNGAFYYYDGFIEGDIALDGGYDGSPFYRKTFDGEIVHFFPFIDKNQEKNCQHAALESSDLAVSKTAVNGDIYYYSIQDNINTSIRTGFKIYIVREDFSTGEPLTIPENEEIEIDLDGHSFTATDTITVNGKLVIEDSKTTIETVEVDDNSLAMPNVSGNIFVAPHNDNTTTTITYAGLIAMPQTLINNGNLVINNARITGNTANDTIRNNGSLTMNGGALGATASYAMQITENGAYLTDKNSYIYSTSTNKPAVYNTTPEFVWDTSGIIYGKYYGVQNGSGKITVKNGTVFGEEAGVYGNVDVIGGTIKSAKTGVISGARRDYGSRSGIVTIQSGEVIVTSTNSSATGIETGSLTMSGGKITATGASTTYGVSDNGVFTLSAGTISATSTGNAAVYGVAGSTGCDFSTKTMNMTGGSIIAKNTSPAGTSGAAYGVIFTSCASYNATFTLEDGLIKASSIAGDSYGVLNNISAGSSNTYLYINGGTVESSSTNRTSFGAYIKRYGYINGGKISGGTYGIYSNDASHPVTIGKNDEDLSIASPEITGGEYGLYNGGFNYYDGVLRGNIAAYQDGVIKAIPDGTTYHIESSEDFTKNCWLVAAENYLSVNDVEYNSLSKAYSAITGDSGTVKVIKSVAVEAILPESPSDKTITFDLNGFQLTLTQPLINNGTMIITDSSEGKTGALNNPNTIKSAVVNNGTLTIDSGHISNTYRTITNSTDSTLTINGGTISSTSIALYNNGNTETTINGGLIEVSNPSSTDTEYGFYNTSTSAQVTMNSGQLRIIRDASASSASVIGFYGGTVNINTGEDSVAIRIENSKGSASGSTAPANNYGSRSGAVTVQSGEIIVSSTNGAATGIETGSLTMSGGKITATGASTTYGVSDNGVFTLSAGTISATSTGNAAVYGVAGSTGCDFSTKTMNMTGGSIIAKNTSPAGTSGAAYGVIFTSCASYNATFTLEDGLIKASSIAGDSYGVLNNISAGSSNTYLYINGGTVESSSTNRTSFGAYIKRYGYINGGKISGGTYGIYSNDASHPVTIGKNDEDLSIASPEITGGEYGLYNGGFNYYDGVLRGNIAAYQDGVIKAIPDGTTLHIEEQIIDDTAFNTCWLEQEHYVARIENTYFTQLRDAITAAQEDDIINLTDDNYLFYELNISAEKQFSIYTNGFNIYTGNAIINNGKITIFNNADSSKQPLNYSGASYYITNNTGAELTIRNFKITATYGIDNKGILTLDNVSIITTNTSINNNGESLTAQNDIVLSGSNYSLYNDNSESNVSDATITNGYIYNNSGRIAINNSTATLTGNNTQNYLINNDDMELNSTNITLTNSALSSSYSSNYYQSVFNKGSLLVSDGSIINHTLNTQSYTYGHLVALYNDGGTIISSDSSIEAIVENVTTHNGDTLSIYNPTGNFTIETGTITAKSKTRNSYGIFNDSGTITIGIPEPEDSPNYGRDTADVSQTNPSITAIDSITSGTKVGIGVKNNTGKVNYYDGVVAGTKSAFAEEPTIKEYLYEVCTELDTSTTPNLYTTKLFWMRDGQSTCANN